MRERTLKTIYDYPKLLEYLDYDKNISEGINPKHVYVSTCNRLWFKTPTGISFHRTAKTVITAYDKYGKLPYQTETLIQGWNDLETLRPEISSVWDYCRNSEHGIYLNNLTEHNGNKAYFRCSNCRKEVEERRFIFSVLRNGVVLCNKCSRCVKTSFQEQTILYYILKLFPNAINGYKDIFRNNMEIDVYIPDYKLGIEYDGGKWHRDYIERQIIKYNLCKENGITLIRASDLTDDNNDCDYKITTNPQPTNEDYMKIINLVCNITNVQNTLDINIDRDKYDILSQYKKVIYEKSFGYKNPEAIEYWDFERNQGVGPYDISANDINKFWFIDKEFGSYKKSPNQITCGKTSYFHPKSIAIKAGKNIRKEVVLYNIKTGKYTIDDFYGVSKILGYNPKSISRLCRGKQKLKNVTVDKKYIVMYNTEDVFDRIKNILSVLGEEPRKDS